ncbi:hypothetical protein HFC70_17860 [Agrobacterium sp. a22-2]|uniref:hypothetical protein n=1 Tax=Agrobacterium sp. a22-2 TaxID=2283840 RepID=UPI0014473926|nr:hypothetical protein [Agrobacterium sp. a22-2]NKN38219.1 hypothetical protein [Agrobacterium sp. a22-2]
MSAQNRAKWFGEERSTERLARVDQVLLRWKTLPASGNIRGSHWGVGKNSHRKLPGTVLMIINPRLGGRAGQVKPGEIFDQALRCGISATSTKW